MNKIKIYAYRKKLPTKIGTQQAVGQVKQNRVKIFISKYQQLIK